MRNSGLTLIEIMISVAIASSICAIGFTGIVAFGRAITRAKQFTSETELITTAIRASIASADSAIPSSKILGTILPVTDNPLLPNPVPVPKNWVSCIITDSGNASQVTFSLQLDRKQIGTSSTYTTASTTGDMNTALKMDAAGKNYLNIQSLPCIP